MFAATEKLVTTEPGLVRPGSWFVRGVKRPVENCDTWPASTAPLWTPNNYAAINQARQEYQPPNYPRVVNRQVLRSLWCWRIASGGRRPRGRTPSRSFSLWKWRQKGEKNCYRNPSPQTTSAQLRAPRVFVEAGGLVNGRAAFHHGDVNWNAG